MNSFLVGVGMKTAVLVLLHVKIIQYYFSYRLYGAWIDWYDTITLYHNCFSFLAAVVYLVYLTSQQSSIPTK